MSINKSLQPNKLLFYWLELLFSLAFSLTVNATKYIHKTLMRMAKTNDFISNLRILTYSMKFNV